jgi:predicted PurR-regulated permease PerM
MSSRDLEPLHEPMLAPEPLRARGVALAGAGLLLLVWLKLVPALLGALIGYVLFRAVGGPTPPRSLRERLRTGFITAVLLAVIGIALFQGFELLVSASHGGMAKLLQLLADTIDHIRGMAPDWVVSHLPDSADDLQRAISAWLRSHAGQMQQLGRDTLRVLFHLIIGIAIGLLAGASMRGEPRAVLPRMAQERWQQLALGFSDILAAQLRIALVNSALTALYLVVVLPLMGYHVPLGLTLVAFTFFAGLLPIIGNLLSNTAIILASLTVSPWLGFASLVFLLAIHKLEYFLNAHFVGSRVSMPPYALLVSMVVLEAAFGAQGLIAAPIYCAWLTRELRDGGWV